jgi:hypothetical protein
MYSDVRAQIKAISSFQTAPGDDSGETLKSRIEVLEAENNDLAYAILRLGERIEQMDASADPAAATAAPNPLDGDCLDGPLTESLERLRLAKAKRKEFVLQRELGQYRSVEEVQQGLGLFSDVLKKGIMKLSAKDRAVMTETLEEAVMVFEAAGRLEAQA